jgi:hypothetical protein
VLWQKLRYEPAFLRLQAGAVDDVSPHIIAPLPLLINKSVWKGEEIRQLLQRPECQQAIQRAKERHPPNLALCPLCSRGRFPDTNISVEYLKIPKAGSTSLVNLITGSTKMQHLNKEAQMLCEGRHPNDFRISMVRDPTLRLISAVSEVNKKRWRKSPNVSYARIKNDDKRRFLQFLEDYFQGRMENWDAGLPHHVMSAAMYIQAIYDMNRTVSVLGKMEDPEAFTQLLSVQVNGKNVTLEKWNARGSSLETGLFQWYQAAAAVLFEEDFVCFGYSLPQNITNEAKALMRGRNDKYRSNWSKHRTQPKCTERYSMPNVETK